MPRARRARRRRDGGKIGPWLVGGTALLILAIALGSYVYFNSNKVNIDPVTSCPLTGPVSITAVILDVTDSLSAIQQADLFAFMEEIRDQVPKNGRLDLYTVEPVEAHPLLAQFQSCNPGSGKDVASDLTGNRALDDRNWKRRFADKLGKAIDEIVQSSPDTSSPLLESVQSVSITSFEGSGAARAEKRLVLVSDLLQYTKRASFYAGAPDFTSFRTTPYYHDVRTELAGTSVTISIIPRDTKRNVQNKKLFDFWTSYFADEGAIVDRWRPIKGGQP